MALGFGGREKPPAKVGDWVEVLRTQSPHRAQLAQAVLEEHYIPAVLLSQQDSSYHAFGNLRVMVHEDMLDKALEVLRSDIEIDLDTQEGDN